MNRLCKALSGGDLRSIGNVVSVISKIASQQDFDGLFNCLFNKDRLIVMRAADAIEKITVTHPLYLAKYAGHILQLCTTAGNKELQWHLAQLIPRLSLTGKTLTKAWDILKDWTMDNKNSRIVRVNSLQGLFDIAVKDLVYRKELLIMFSELEKENIPSLNARIKLLKKISPKNNRSLFISLVFLVI